MHRDIGPSDPANTTDTLTLVGDPIDGRAASQLTVVVENAGDTNAADFVLEGAAVDDGDYFELDTLDNLLASGSGVLQLPAGEYWTRYRVTAKSHTGGAATSVRIAGGCALLIDA